MKFTNIPKNGASWNDKLLYSFSTELEQPSDVVVVVRDVDTGAILGEMRLYSVTEATVDISSIIRRSVSLEPPIASSPTIVVSPSLCHVVVEVEGVASPDLLLFRAPFLANEHQILSTMTHENGVALGDTLRFTVNAVKVLSVVIHESIRGRIRVVESVQFSGSSMPVEVVIPLTSLSASAEKIEVAITNGLVKELYEYQIVERSSTSRTLLWYNSRGGIESYAFSHSRSVSRKADVTTIATTEGSRAWLNGAESIERLTSATLSSSEQERLAEIICSPYIYEEYQGKIIPHSLARREIGYDDHGALQRLSLDIVEVWKGGGL